MLPSPGNPIGPPGKTVLYMIRHGEPHEDYHGCYYGQMDVPLSERGIRQSSTLAERLTGIPFNAVYSSDLERAGHLADALAEPLDLPVRKVEVFRERNLGVFQGMREEEMRDLDAEQFEAWMADRALHRIEGAENYEDLTERIVPSILNLIQNFEGGRIALVTHAGPIRVTLAHVLGMPLGAAFRFVLDYACVNVIEFPTEGPPRIKLMNG